MPDAGPRQAASRPETSAALLTPPGKGGIAVISVAGGDVGRVLSSVFRPFKSHRHAGPALIRLGRLVDDGRTIDEAVVHECGNYAEINIHGGPAAARATLELLSRHGVRVIDRPAGDSFSPAHPRHGNPAVGREMLEALPAAKSALVAAALTQQWSGGISELARRAFEANATRQYAGELREAADGLGKMSKLLNPPAVVIAGPPNVGKSALTNALVGRQVSIVDESVGTTRDWVRELALIGGVPLWLTDTAGLWEAPGAVDAEAVRRARQRAERADLVVLLEAGGQAGVPPWLHARKVIAVSAKCDILPPRAGQDVSVSALTGEGLDRLQREILKSLELDGIDPATPMAFTERQAALLERSAEAFEADDEKLARRNLKVLLAG